jgi:type VI protein secretion system component VasA
MDWLVPAAPSIAMAQMNPSTRDAGWCTAYLEIAQGSLVFQTTSKGRLQKCDVSPVVLLQ